MASVPRKIGVLVAQLGTPDAPTAKALRPYLAQFLSDMRVIDYNPFFWQLLLRGVILRTRPKKSARLYARIWMKEGSPLLHYSNLQATGLQARLGDGYRVVLGMRYGTPSIAEAIRTLEGEGIDRIVALSMFPQFSSTTTASIYDAVYTAAAGRRCPLFHERKRFVPTLRFVEPYYDHPGYIQALKARVEESVHAWGSPPDKVLITFHGIPNRYIQTGDPYRAQSERTAQLLAEALNLTPDQWLVSFQSRFGPEEWLQPYTDRTLEEMHHQGIERVLVFSPGFTADCLETLDELGNEGRDQFLEGGGKAENYRLAPCLNDHPTWLNTMTDIVRHEAQGWSETVLLSRDGIAAKEG
jgi:protoporphyrin/coproporphyrin ferrochelatase